MKINALKVLAKLEEQGYFLPHLLIFSDGSGRITYNGKTPSDELPGSDLPAAASDLEKQRILDALVSWDEGEVAPHVAMEQAVAARAEHQRVQATGCEKCKDYEDGSTWGNDAVFRTMPCECGKWLVYPKQLRETPPEPLGQNISTQECLLAEDTKLRLEELQASTILPEPKEEWKPSPLEEAGMFLIKREEEELAKLRDKPVITIAGNSAARNIARNIILASVTLLLVALMAVAAIYGGPYLDAFYNWIKNF